MSTVSCVWPVLGTVLYGAVRTLYGCGLAARRRNGATCRGDGQPPGFLFPVPWRHGPARARRRQGGRDRADGRARVRVTCRSCLSLPFCFGFLFSHIRLCDAVGRAGTFFAPVQGGSAFRSGGVPVSTGSRRNRRRRRGGKGSPTAYTHLVLCADRLGGGISSRRPVRSRYHARECRKSWFFLLPFSVWHTEQ